MEKYDCDIKSTLLFPFRGGEGGGWGSTHNVNICDKSLDRVSAMNSFVLCWLSKLGNQLGVI